MNGMPRREPFEFPPRVGDSVLRGLGLLERGTRSLLRAARGGRPLKQLRRSGISARARGHPARPDWEPASPPEGPSVIYLAALPWSYRPQRPQHLAAALSEAGRSVLYVGSFLRLRCQPTRHLQEVRPGVWSLELRIPGRPDPFRQPLPPGAVADLSARLIAGIADRPDFVFAQLPFWQPLAVALRESLRCPLVYDRIDLHEGFRGVVESAAEQELLAAADLVVATSHDLAERSAATARRVELLPNAVEIQRFAFRPTPPGRPTDTLKIVYVGALEHWFDADAVRQAALLERGWTFHLAGRVDDMAVEALAELPNVRLYGEIPYSRVAEFFTDADAALIPFLDLPLTRAVDPVKLYEAMAVGLPVVARRLPSLDPWPEPLLYLYDEPLQLAAQIRRACGEDDAQARRERRRSVESTTWATRAAQLLQRVASLR